MASINIVINISVLDSSSTLWYSNRWIEHKPTICFQMLTHFWEKSSTRPSLLKLYISHLCTQLSMFHWAITATYDHSKPSYSTVTSVLLWLGIHTLFTLENHDPMSTIWVQHDAGTHIAVTKFCGNPSIQHTRKPLPTTKVCCKVCVSDNQILLIMLESM